MRRASAWLPLRAWLLRLFDAPVSIETLSDGCKLMQQAAFQENHGQAHSTHAGSCLALCTLREQEVAFATGKIYSGLNKPCLQGRHQHAPAAASTGFQGRSSMHLKRQETWSLLSSSSKSVTVKLTSDLHPGRASLNRQGECSENDIGPHVPTPCDTHKYLHPRRLEVCPGQEPTSVQNQKGSLHASDARRWRLIRGTGPVC